MKNMLVNITLSVLLMAAMSGCGDNGQKGETDAKGMASFKQTRSLSDSKKGFEANLQALSRYGLKSNLTSPGHYRLDIIDPKKALFSLMLLADQSPASIDAQDLKALEKALSTLDFGVEVDWTKYQESKPKSVLIYLIDTEAKAPLKKLLDEKKLSAYLSYDDHDVLKQILFNDLNETLHEDNSTVSIKMKDTRIDFALSPSTTSSKSAYTLTSALTRIDYRDEETNTTASAGYKHLTCDVKKENTYLGMQTCKIPEMTFALFAPAQLEVGLYNSTYTTNNTLHDKKVKSDVGFKIDTIKGNVVDDTKKGTFEMKTLAIDVVTDNIDEKTMQDFVATMRDANRSVNELTKLVGEVYSHGTTIDYRVSLDVATGDFPQTQVLLKGYTGEGKATFDENISYRDISRIDTLSVTDKTAKTDTFAMHHMQFGYSLRNLYNFIPSLVDYSGTLTTANPDEIDAMSLKWIKMTGEKVVHNGVGFDLDPIGFDDLKLQVKNKKISFDTLFIALHTVLKRNDVPLDINNPLTGMMLLPYLQADGKIVIKKKDLETLATQLPPAMVGMAMMMGKPQGDSLVYDLKFENGHLLVNGQPIL